MDAQGNPLAVYELLGGDFGRAQRVQPLRQQPAGYDHGGHPGVRHLHLHRGSQVYLSPVGNKRYELVTISATCDGDQRQDHAN